MRWEMVCSVVDTFDEEKSARLSLMDQLLFHGRDAIALGLFGSSNLTGFGISMPDILGFKGFC
jgi:hypothetical protein